MPIRFHDLLLLAGVLALQLRVSAISGDRPKCSRYLGENATNVHQYVLRRTLKIKDVKGPFKWIKRINTLRGKRLMAQAWDVKHEGNVFGQILLDPVLRPLRMLNEAGTEVGNCRIGVQGLLFCGWPVEGIEGLMKYDDKANTGTVTAQKKLNFWEWSMFWTVNPSIELHTRGQLWNKDPGNMFENIRNKTKDSLRKKIVFEGNQGFLNNIRVAIVKHFFRLMPTYSICIATDSPVELDEAKKQALMFASVGVTYSNAEQMQRLKWTLAI